MTTETHCAQILAHLKSGKHITGIEALDLFGCFRLPARILELKESGHAISKQMVKTPGGARVAEYWMERQQ